VDNYILAAIEFPDGSTLDRLGRTALHAIHGMFPPPAQLGHAGGKDPISLNKIEAGDAQWAHTKELLGFMYDCQARTVHLMQRKALGITDAITRLLKKSVKSPASAAYPPLSGFDSGNYNNKQEAACNLINYKKSELINLVLVLTRSGSFFHRSS
jgi:hypothetical protein